LIPFTAPCVSIYFTIKGVYGEMDSKHEKINIKVNKLYFATFMQN